jgi:hypothetical protein
LQGEPSDRIASLLRGNSSHTGSHNRRPAKIFLEAAYIAEKPALLNLPRLD